MCLRLDICHGVKLVLFCVQDREGHIAGLSVVRGHRGVLHRVEHGALPAYPRQAAHGADCVDRYDAQDIERPGHG